MAIKTPFHSSACALIIGIDDYTTFDATGGSDLKGSVNDAVAVAQLCLDLGMKPEDIHVVSGKSRERLGVTRTRRTTLKSISREIAWLRSQLEAGRQGLFWFSGHGAHNEKGLLLCPSDTTPDLAQTLPFRSLRRKIGKQAARNLTVVLDCCHGGSVADHLGRPTKTLGGDPRPEDIADAEMEIGAVVLAACAVEEQTQQSCFASRWHGAFTWALLAAVNQWQMTQQGSNVRLDVTYRELVKRATVLLDALDFKGSPQIFPRGAGGLAMLQQGEAAMTTAERPDAERAGIQVDPTQRCALYVFALLNADGTRLQRKDGQPVSAGCVLSVNANVTVEAANTRFPAPGNCGWEWWWYGTELVDNFSRAAKIEFVRQYSLPDGVATPNRDLDDALQTLVRLAGADVSQTAWTSRGTQVVWDDTTDEPSTGLYYADATDPSHQYGIQIDSSGVTWFSNAAHDSIVLGSDTTFTSQPITPAPGTTWKKSKRDS